MSESDGRDSSVARIPRGMEYFELVDGVGIPFENFQTAVQVWSFMQAVDQPQTVADAAALFQVKPAVIVKAVEEHPWMYLNGPDDDYSKMIIEHDGE